MLLIYEGILTVTQLELPYQYIDSGGSAGGLDQPNFLAMNPNGRIPVLVDDDVTIWESNSIVRYLCAQYSHDRLWAETPAKRSLAERWMDWELATLQPDFLDLFWGFYRTPEALRGHQKIQHASERCQKHLAILDAHLANQTFLAGEEFSMGDKVDPIVQTLNNHQLKLVGLSYGLKVRIRVDLTTRHSGSILKLSWGLGSK